MQSATILIGRVQELIKDGSFGPSFILEKLNDGLAEVAQITSPPDLIELNVDIRVVASKKFVRMPADFYGPRILRLHNKTDNTPCAVVYRFVDFSMLSSRFSRSNIHLACLKGRQLHVSGAPLVDTVLSATYLREPTIFVDQDDDGSSIEYLPFRLGEQAIVSYAAWRIYSHIEDGVDGKKINSETYRADFLDATAKIMNYFGMEAKEQEPELVSDLIGISGDIGIEQTFVGKL